MDPVSAVAQGVGSIFDWLTAGKMAKYGRLPDWLSPKDFNDQDKRTQTLIISGVVILIVILGAIIFTITRKK